MLTVNGTELQTHQLKGPVGYTVVGSPTIIDGVASGFDNNPATYIKVDTRINFDQDFDIAIYFTMPSFGRNFSLISKGGNRIGGLQLLFPYNNVHRFYLYNSDGSQAYYYSLSGYTLAFDTSYIYHIQRVGDQYTWTLKDSTDTQTLLTHTDTATVTFDTCAPAFGANVTSSTYTPFDGSINFNKTYIKVNGKLWFYQPADTKYIVKDGKLVWADPLIYIEDSGTKTYATQNIAPVPAGYTYGTTTTPSIGYVDMRTQQFTAAPTGATIGREEE